ncbi:MAG TPA: 6-phosphogluconolactonase [Kiritimatiellia bacterium]|nr:6-phosphogluconolactonase [Kiritimatiellia bacterium]HNR93542.1 6-phosphogluconolactonase [Kiritimatiellia bacterium]HNS81538.1 6-phosphogluconolactonase [Kiritimatiellia bacterium]HPA78337.1 6-phosphogluconolactonase [Kiritimatiellia bacterium]HQQ04433.1 6-phosphogluconolactonase [Kiritimatiellia bacterium]
MLTFREFKTEKSLARRVRQKLQQVIESARGPSAIMLSGGRTPLPVYRDLASRKIRVSPDVHFFLSDERMVPPDSPDSNQGAIAPLLVKAGAAEDRFIRVNTSHPLVMAAAEYGARLEDFHRAGGKFPFGLLGLGSDGHTASLFTLEDARSETGYFAIPVERIGDFDRVSVTPAMMRNIGQIVFLVAGADKAVMLEVLRTAPETIPAGAAVRECANAEVWFTA